MALQAEILFNTIAFILIKYGTQVLGQLCDFRTSYIASVTIV